VKTIPRTTPLHAAFCIAGMIVLLTVQTARPDGWHEAARNNDLAGLAAMLRKDGRESANRRIEGGVAPMHIAAGKGNIETVAYLLGCGADPDVVTDNGFTPLHWAAGNNSRRVVEMLVDAGATINTATEHGVTPLHWAASRNAVEAVQALLEKGANPELKTSKGLTALHWAVMEKAEDAATVIAGFIAGEHPPALAELEKPALLDPRKPFEESLARQTNTVTTAAMTETDRGRILSLKLSDSVTILFVWIEPLKLWAGQYEITNLQFRQFRARHDSRSAGAVSLNDDEQPAVNVNWNDAIGFCNWLNRHHAGAFPPGFYARLPTSTEWDVLARCGTSRTFPWGDQWPPDRGNYFDESARTEDPSVRVIKGYDDGYPAACPVTDSGVNEWNLYGMGGNAWEWCSDWFDSHKQYKRRKGGAWDSDRKENLTIDSVGFDRPDAAYETIGFRIILSP
jgi:formylglycine-generating enzyme